MWSPRPSGQTYLISACKPLNDPCSLLPCPPSLAVSGEPRCLRLAIVVPDPSPAVGTRVAPWPCRSGPSFSAQIPGRNVNMVSGTEWPGGDPFLQRQNEPSIAASTRNPLHLLAGSNDYRTVDVPGLPDGDETGDAWLGVYKSFDGGQRWSSTLLPGYPQDTSPRPAWRRRSRATRRRPIRWCAPAPTACIYYNGLVFDRGENGRSGIFVARFIDRNNKENGDPIDYLGHQHGGAVHRRAGVPRQAVDGRGHSARQRRTCAWSAAATATGARVKRNGHRGNGDAERRHRAARRRPTSTCRPARSTSSTRRSPATGRRCDPRSSSSARWTAASPGARRCASAARPTPINQGATLAIDPADRRRASSPGAASRRPDAPDRDAIMMARLPLQRRRRRRARPGARAAPARRRPPRRSSASSSTARSARRSRSRTCRSSIRASRLRPGTTEHRHAPASAPTPIPTMTVDGAGRAYMAWTERGFAAAPARGRSTATRAS